MLCLGQERRGLCPWPRHSPASVLPLDWKGKEQTKTECKTCRALSAHGELRGVVLHGAVWGTVLLETGGQSGGSVGEGSAQPWGAKGVSSASGIELRGAPSPGEMMNPGGCWAAEVIPGRRRVPGGGEPR